ncbi:MAG: protein translocase subunit SecF, partial [Desulfobulbaceae bacterium]
DSINKGLTSGVFGTIMVIGFMLIYYRASGVIANSALVLNILFIFAGLAILNATLTMPGIAGIVLSIGMAVDSNILIFERMREESDIGKSVRSSIETGFGKAFLTIVDSQVTTLISALALFWFGTGPIKGFAITLSLGILCNLFTALFCSRLLFDTLHVFKPLKQLKFLRFTKKPNYNFLGIKKTTFIISGITSAIGLFALIQITLGHANLGVDFTGGSLLQYKAETSFTMEEVRKAFSRNNVEGVDLQEVENESRLMVKVKKSEEVLSGISETITSTLTKELPEKKFVLESQSEIGSSVSSALRDKAFLAILLSLGGIVVYLAIRFDFRFGVGALIATLHDILCVIGICWLVDIEFTLLIVTALLTLAGYSVNDSVIVFDRIRENLHKSEERSISDVINLSVNQVLSRTIVTGLTTILSILALYFLGGSIIHDFSFTLLIGIIIGTYSSVFVASPILTLFPEKKI